MRLFAIPCLALALVVNACVMDEDVEDGRESPAGGWDLVVTASDTPRSIPDQNATGVTSAIQVGRSDAVTNAQVRVDITHTYVSDLRLVLLCPNGSSVTLRNRTGGSADDIHDVYAVSGCNGQSAAGSWRLVVSDHAGQDVGTIDNFELSLAFGQAPTGWDFERVSADTPLGIPDANSTGISSRIAIASGGAADQSVSEAEIEVSITHTYIGDLRVRLQCPNGTLATLHDRSGGGADNLRTAYGVSACNGQPAAGSWRLLVSDHAGQDVGTLDRWTLRLRVAGGGGGGGEPTNLTISGVHGWYLIGNSLTPGQNSIALRVTGPSTATVYASIDGGAEVALTRNGTEHARDLSIGSLAAGLHTLSVRADGATGAQVQFRRSHPLYVAVTNDWDTADHSNQALTLQEELHADHAELKLTHFVGPYTFTDSTVSSSRRAFLINWLQTLRSSYDDEIGLHIHPYCNFVQATGNVTCRTTPSYTQNSGDSSGYTVLCAAYTETEFGQMLAFADQLFVANGLGKPTSFRAGGWTANLATLRALAAAGYVADTSANNWARLEEWDGLQNGVLYDWNRTHWSIIGDTSQPYYPSQTDIQRTGANVVPILEVPDNGSLVDYVSGGEMIGIFDANWNANAVGGALARPVSYVIGYHPVNYGTSYHARIQQALDHVDGFLASQHEGPVVYETLSNLTLVWR